MSNSHLKRLLILRHSKAAWPMGVDDHERPLEERGHQDAPEAGRWMVKHGLIPDFILCSSALRTRQTTIWVCDQLGEKAPTPKLESRLYAASAARMLSVVNHVPDTVRTLLLVAHMPGVQDLVLRLASRDSDEESYMDAASHFPTTGLAVLEHDLPWAELDGQDARLTHFAVPRAKHHHGHKR
ncbi:histidine phosphatase family protein [Paenarthrobacter sp. DKR-5]|uniref:SixA phosphatase family protein n=1 Tax=Paenarthrobacter sp. DKR-5 TaxID=2835535 RepID=UPI001BDD7A7C|nr:histidine phosphatase family protein [Paenarthrobacter sp. DKR-5]MBT1003569.1 histidine phosphatase family protein [Paenarthrobacter sp. DKR-5]